MIKSPPALTLVALAFTSTLTNATPLDYGDGAENFAEPGYLKNKDGKFDYWRGIGRFSGPLPGYCTAFIIDTKSQSDADPVYALTSAHCVSKKNGIIEVDKPIEGAITFNYFIDTEDAYQSFPLKKVIWSSIQGVDIAILELNTTQGELKDSRITPLKLASMAPPENTDILIVNAASTTPLRAAACVQHASAALFEKPWVWRHSVRNQCAGISGGSSGSPVLVRSTNEVYAVLGTRAMDVTRLPGYDYVEKSNYGSPTALIDDCFINGKINTNPDSCQLFPSASLSLPSDINEYAKISTGKDGVSVFPSWSFPINASTRYYRYKKVKDPVECENPHNYSHSLEANSSYLNVEIGPTPGINNLCIVTTDSTDKLLPAGTYKNSVTIPAYLHPAGPTPMADVTFFYMREYNRVSIEWPERKIDGIAYYQRKHGNPETIDCNIPQGYATVNSNMIRRESNFPMKVCSIAYDTNNQASPVREYIMGWSDITGSAP
ncbi:trypsin-like peptidase domain-containing protein [Pseudomonas sp. McL0111]|uniref:trypsin-like peptidase domain-containing protein n=1 Tax=Pseudomonas sp. McL0111 TaxID=3457357 RepID=UPI00403E8C4F